MRYTVTILRNGKVIAEGDGRTDWLKTATRLYNRAKNSGRYFLATFTDGNGIYCGQFGYSVQGGVSLDPTVTIHVASR